MKRICVLALWGAALFAGSAFAEAGDNPLLARYGLFVLDNGDVKSLTRGTKIKTYRVCMEAGADAVPLKVLHDGKETIVVPGECHLIEAKNIRMLSAARLREDRVLIGHRRFYSTPVASANAVATTATD